MQLCLLVGFEILGPLLNTFSSDHMYSCHNWQELPKQIQTQLSLKPSNFLQVLLHFRNLHKLRAFLNKDPFESLYMSGVIDYEKCGY